MNKNELKNITEGLIEIFNVAGQESIDLYAKGLKIEIKSDNSPVSNGDLKCNELITNKILEQNKHMITGVVGKIVVQMCKNPTKAEIVVQTCKITKIRNKNI